MTKFKRMIRRKGEDFTYTGFTEGFDSKYLMPVNNTKDNGLRIAGSAAWDVLNGDIDLRCKVNFLDYSRSWPDFPDMHLKFSNNPQSNSWLWRFRNNGQQELQFSDNVNNLAATTSIKLPAFLDGTTIWLRVTLDIDDGAGNRVITFYYSLDNEASWVLHQQIVQAGAMAELSVSANIPFYWGRDAAGNNRPECDMFRATIHNGIDGPIFLDIDIAKIVPGSLSFTEIEQGFEVTVEQGAGDPQSEITPSEINTIDPHGDVTYIADGTPPLIRGIRVDNGQRTLLAPTGEERQVDISVLVPDPLFDSQAIRLILEDDMTKRAATMTDTDGRLYNILGVGHEASSPIGAQRILCAKQPD